MAHVRVSEEKIVVSERSLASTLLRAPANRHVFAKNVSIADNQFNDFAAKRVILRIPANHAEGMKHVVLAKSRRPLNYCMRMQHAAITQLHVFAHHGKRADLHTFSQLRVRRHGRSRMSLGLRHFADFSACSTAARSIILHINVAPAASWPSTVARPESLQKSPRQLSTVISTRN